MEIYRFSQSSIDIDMPVGFNNAVFRIIKDSTQVATGNPSSTTASSVTVAIPYAQTIFDTRLDIQVDFYLGSDKFTRSTIVEVVTPILPLSEIKSILKPANPTGVSDTEAQLLESKVRQAIQAYTGQLFGKYQGWVEVYGNGDGFIQSPRRILSLDNLTFNNVSYNSHSYIVKGDGWYIERSRGYPLTIKQAPPDEVLDVYDSYFTNGPISAPDAVYYNKFNSKTAYRIYGTFGYEYIPSDVLQAARILVNDYGCNESIYRDRYIGNIRAADWRFEFKDGAFIGTGNVMADQLLAPYQRSNMVII